MTVQPPTCQWEHLSPHLFFALHDRMGMRLHTICHKLLSTSECRMPCSWLLYINFISHYLHVYNVLCMHMLHMCFHYTEIERGPFTLPQYYDLAADVLAENTHLTYKCLSPYLYDFIDAKITQQTSAEEVGDKSQYYVHSQKKKLMPISYRKSCQKY